MRFRNRRGAFVVIAAILFLGMVGVSAIAIDFSRLWTLRNELQTSADASAMGGALQLIGARNPAQTVSAARAFAADNRAMGRVVTVDSVELGTWNDATRFFTLNGTPNDAVRVVVADTMRGLLMSAFGIAKPRLKARAVGWAGASISSIACIKPWAIPYESLMYTLNVFRNINPPASNANLTRAFDQIADIAALNTMTAAQRTFTLKLGGGGAVTAPAGGYVGTNLPGNYQAVGLPKLWDAATGTYPTPGPQNGANAYRNNIAGTTCNSIAVGDSLATEPGNMVGPTMQGIEPAVCATIVQSGANTGDCLNSAGLVGVNMISSFFSCGTSCNGRSVVAVDLLGSFILTKAYPRNFGIHDKAEIAGIFNPVQATGPVGPGPSTLKKVILVQ